MRPYVVRIDWRLLPTMVEDLIHAGNVEGVSALFLEHSKDVESAIKLAEGIVKRLSSGVSMSVDSTILTTTSPADAVGHVFCTIPNVQFLQPKGRFDLVFGSNQLALRSKQLNFEIDWENVEYLLSIPRKVRNRFCLFRFFAQLIRMLSV